MKKPTILILIAMLLLISYAINEYDSNTECYEIVKIDNIHADVKLNKCTGKTHMLILDESSPYDDPSASGTESAEKEEDYKYFQWVLIPTGNGIAISSEK